jgi:hypothetical protein
MELSGVAMDCDERLARKRAYYAANRERLSAQAKALYYAKRGREVPVDGAPEPATLLCEHCHAEKPTDLFKTKTAAGRSNGLMCLDCFRTKDRDRASTARKQQPEKTRDSNRRRYTSNPLVWIVGVCKARALAAGVPFALTVESVPPVPDACPVSRCGVQMKRRREGGRGPAPNSPSLDRTVPELGYVPSNVSWMCQSCNSTKYHNPQQWALISSPREGAQP